PCTADSTRIVPARDGKLRRQQPARSRAQRCRLSTQPLCLCVRVLQEDSMKVISNNRGTVIVGSETAARKLYSEIVASGEAPENYRFVDYLDIGGLSQRENISRVVVADGEIQQGSAAAQALIDLKLRGVRIESAWESFERQSRKIWLEGLSAERLIFANGFCPSTFYLNA